ncbi:LutB/LldF family L-lactate oxidation iron-sulfur protein [Blastopirellula marina]|uniref:Iron-sulfur cluster-binding protein n=1 Tax=Blastopirellula marina TaxID=124 RepID=A0A2S8GMR4_9BACT|nr:LutB/LldF family L-lactate oxidation iron-sulfur protein [Blastopirellula marina]PQO45651.1 iron-sulfur cluster-binding protein [Blastopirellula marina]
MSQTTNFDHPTNARKFNQNQERTHWHDTSLWFIREKRDRMANSLPEWETLRSCASQIKAHTVSKLADYLEQFEKNARARGATVHWAKDADEHNRIVLEILQKHDAQRVVKSKSMLTEECHLNPFLEKHGLEVVDTDLGERIVQLRQEGPSHIVMPAIHLKKEDVSETFHEHLNTEAGNFDPNYLTESARQHLRNKFMEADVGITGVNFALADTGGVVVCTNEGNADLGVSLPPVHIASMGIEKLIPSVNHLSIFLRLLARSATGQPITTYSSHFHGPREGGELHIILVDNGRSNLMNSEKYRNSLKCIRCGACMNTCPVYRRSGGHSYGATVPGPIGSILNPLRDAKHHKSLPFACTLCGSCSDVCPVKINLHEQLLTLRTEVKNQKQLPASKTMPMRIASWVFQRPKLYAWLGGIAKFFLRTMPRFMIYHALNPWGRQREMPESPPESFRQQYAKRNKNKPQ